VRVDDEVSTWTWPTTWQSEVREILAPLVGSEDRVDLLVGDPATPHSGTRYAGYVYAENGELWLIHDRSGRSDIYPWRLPIGPVLRLDVIKGPRKRSVVYRHPDWTDPSTA
jgi:hypothetical protein